MANLYLGGSSPDGEVDALPNARAIGDDIFNAPGNDDEDGLSNPLLDLQVTVGTQPTVNVIVTNMTRSLATLVGWIDYDANGDFSNASERASVSVPHGSNHGRFTLTFPTVPLARLRQ